MSRRFDGVDDRVDWTAGSVAITGALTIASILKLDTGVTWQGYMGTSITATGSEMAMSRHSTSGGQIHLARGGGAGGDSGAIAHSSSDGWMLIAISKASGTVTPRAHKYPIGGSPTHTDGATTVANGAAQNSYVFGEIDGADFFDGWLAAAAIFPSALSDGDIESLVTTMTRANWVSKSPAILVDELDVFQTDYGTGGSTRNSITGTTDDADDPTGWASWAGAAAEVIPDLVLARYA